MTKLSVLLTGPGGRIGKHILPAFQERFDLKVLDKTPVPGFDTILDDLSHIDTLREAMTGVDVVVHLAAQADEAPFDVLLPPNIVGTYNVLEAARLADVRRVVFASTMQAISYYPRDYTVQIDDPPRSVSVYGVTKVWGESLGRFYYDKHKLEFVGVRIGAFQPYDSDALPAPNGWARDIWLSPRDAAEILCRCAERPGIGYGLLFATSITRFERMSRQPMRDLLDYVPQDDVMALYPETGDAAA